jgi:hypothetical protein
MTGKRAAHNSGLAKKRVSCFYDTFVVNETFVLLMNIRGNNPLLRQAANRYMQARAIVKASDKNEN